MSDTASTTSIYYDPYDAEIDNDPYPVWKRLRDEAPLYYNEKHDFYALSRWADVAPALADWKTYHSGRGTTIDIIKTDAEIPPGLILWEDPPLHDIHRKVLAGVFTPMRMNAIEPLVRNFCTRALDNLVGADGFDVIADLGELLPTRTIGYLLGIPEESQMAIRRHVDEALSLDKENPQEFDANAFKDIYQLFAEYIEWREKNPSNDLMTDLLNADIEENGQRRRLTRTEVLTYVSMIAGAGAETATRLIGFTVQLLAEHPDQRRQILADRSLIPRAIEEALRFEAPSPVQGRYVARDVEHYGRVVPKGSTLLLLNGAANRDESHFENPDQFDIHRKTETPPHLSFGYGLHFCLGAALARLEGRVALDEILKRWPEWEVDYAHAHKAHTTSVRGWASLPIRTKKP